MYSKYEKIYISILVILLLISSIILIISYKNRKESYVELIKNPKMHIIYFSGDLISQNDKDIKLPQDLTEKIENIIDRHKNELSICTLYKFNPIIVSTNINQDNWNNLCKYIANIYDNYDSFVIIHGNDTITYTASALTYMFENLKKPIVITNINNLYIALKYATISKLPIVAIAIDNKKIYKGDNCSFKCSGIIESVNLEDKKIYPLSNDIIANLNDSELIVNYNNMSKDSKNQSNTVIKTLNPSINVCIFKLYPNISGKNFKESILNLKCNALILDLYGNGNTQTDKNFLLSLRELNDSGILIIAHTNESNSSISIDLEKCGVILINNKTLESIYCFLLFLLTYIGDIKEIRNILLPHIK